MIKRYKEDEIEKLVQILKNDGVISVPTDTVFGICARMNSQIAHDKLVKIKKRPINKAFPVMCANEEQIKSGEHECADLDEIEKACPHLDGMMEGEVLYSKGSTIIDCSTDEIKILREGPISIEQIKEIVRIWEIERRKYEKT